MNRRIGVLLSYILMGVEVLSTLLLTPFILRTLGQAEYGVYKLAAAINAYLLLLDLGVGNAITRYIAKYRVEKNDIQGRKFLGIAIIYYLIIAIITIVIGSILIYIFPTVFSNGLSKDEIALGRKLLFITMINSAVTLGTAEYEKIIIAYEKFFVSKGSSIIQIILRMVLTVIALKFGMGSVGIVSVNLLMTLFCRAFFIYYTLFKIELKPMFKEIELSFVKEVFLYSSLILLQMIATQINNTVDQILIGSLVASSSIILAIYGVGTQIVQYFQSIGSAFNGVLMPGLVKMVSEDCSSKRITKEMIRISRIIFMVLLMIWSGFFVNGQIFIDLWAGTVNEKAYVVAILLMSVQLFVLSEAVGTQILWAMNQHKEQSILKIVIVFCNIGLTMILIKWDALIGATVGTFLSILLGDVVTMNIIFYKKIKINLLNYYKCLFKGILPSAVVSIIVGLVIKEFITYGWFALLINVLAMVIVYISCMMLFGLNEYEKSLCFEMIKKISKKVYKRNKL